jgi:hypothetical protein
MASKPCGSQYVGKNMIYPISDRGKRDSGMEIPLNRHMSEATPENTPKERLNVLNNEFHAKESAMHMMLKEK